MPTTDIDAQHNFRAMTWEEAREQLDAIFSRVFDLLRSNPSLHALVDGREGEPPAKAGDFAVDYRDGNLRLKFSDGKQFLEISFGALGGSITAAQHGFQPAEYDPGTGVQPLHPLVTTTDLGFMSAADKVKLNGLSNTGLSSATPDTVNAAAGSAGVATDASRSDHSHQVSVGTPVAIGTSNANGSSNNLARADHVHSHGNQAGGALHAAATTSAAGFMSAADKSKLDGYEGIFSQTSTPTTGQISAGNWGIWYDTNVGGRQWVVFNDGGTIRKLGPSA